MVEHEQTYELPAEASSIAAARAIVADLSEGLPQDARDDAALLVSELMSNVVRHGEGVARLTVGFHDGALRVAVHDEGSGRPAMPGEQPDRSMTSGRGLRIVDRVAQRWGVDPDRGDGVGKTVWFQLVVAGVTASNTDTEDRKVWS